MNDIKNESITKQNEEFELKASSGFGMLFLGIILALAAVFGTIAGGMLIGSGSIVIGVILLTVSILWLCICWIPFIGLKVIKPNEALVLTLFGKYKGTLKKDGFYFVNPFCTAVNPAAESSIVSVQRNAASAAVVNQQQYSVNAFSKKLSLKAMTLVNNKQKVNDKIGNPIEVGIIVIWRIQNTAKAVFNVDNYKEYVSTQADSTLRDVARLYPYDIADDGDDGDEKSLRGSSQEVAEKLKTELQRRVDIAGIEVLDTRITHLAYASEIASAMLQRQQASAIIEARQKIVEGAVGMVQMALEKLNEGQICELDEERKAAMVSNLLVVLCGNKDAQPIVNSGSIY